MLECSSHTDTQGMTEENQISQALRSQNEHIDNHDRTLQHILIQQRELGGVLLSIEQKFSAIAPKDPTPPLYPAPTLAPSTNTTINREPDIRPSELFEGNPKLLGGFLLQCDLAFCRAPITYASDASQISYIVSSLKGEELCWAHAHLRSWPIHFLPYSSFIQEFRRAFDPPLLQEEAVQRLFTLRQGSRSVSEFSICFRIITEESVLKGAFLHALNIKIRDQIATHKAPQDLEELFSLAIRIDNRNRERAMEKD